MAADDRIMFRARVTPAAWEGWDRTITDENVTLTALVEAIGLELREGWDPPPHAVRVARQIDRHRRSRS